MADTDIQAFKFNFAAIYQELFAAHTPTQAILDSGSPIDYILFNINYCIDVFAKYGVSLDAILVSYEGEWMRGREPGKFLNVRGVRVQIDRVRHQLNLDAGFGSLDFYSFFSDEASYSSPLGTKKVPFIVYYDAVTIAEYETRWVMHAIDKKGPVKSFNIAKNIN